MQIEAMRSVAKASHNRSISELKELLSQFHKELKDDPIIAAHLEKLYDNLLEQNLLRVIEPFSKVQVSGDNPAVESGLSVLRWRRSNFNLFM